MLHVRGRQDVDIQAHHPYTDSAVVALRVGAALLYFHDWSSAATVSRAWSRCSTDAVWLPPRTRFSTRAEEATDPVSAVAVIDIFDGGELEVSTTLDSPPGEPKRLIVDIGRLEVVVHDRSAYLSLRTALTAARETAAAVFLPGPPRLRAVVPTPPPSRAPSAQEVQAERARARLRAVSDQPAQDRSR